jgi:hypothetical protein
VSGTFESVWEMDVSDRDELGLMDESILFLLASLCQINMKETYASLLDKLCGSVSSIMGGG